MLDLPLGPTEIARSCVVLLIVMGAAGSALLLGVILGVSLIASGLQQWRIANR